MTRPLARRLAEAWLLMAAILLLAARLRVWLAVEAGAEAEPAPYEAEAAAEAEPAPCEAEALRLVPASMIADRGRPKQAVRRSACYTLLYGVYDRCNSRIHIFALPL